MRTNPQQQKKEIAVKRILSMCSVFLFAFGSMSYGANQESGSVSFPNTVRVGANDLPAGTYKVRWQAGSSEVQITLSGNGHEISVPATATPSVGQNQVLEHRVGNTQVVDGFTIKDTNLTIKNP
jgi:hypothetical protein